MSQNRKTWGGQSCLQADFQVGFPGESTEAGSQARLLAPRAQAQRISPIPRKTPATSGVQRLVSTLDKDAYPTYPSLRARRITGSSNCSTGAKSSVSTIPRDRRRRASTCSGFSADPMAPSFSASGGSGRIAPTTTKVSRRFLSSEGPLATPE